MLELPPDVKENAIEYCLQFRQSMSYRTDIADYSGTKPMDWDWDWDRFDLGSFSTIRSLQFTIRWDKERPNESDDTPSVNTRSYRLFAVREDGEMLEA
ncbi:hypothetical protein ACN38_g11208 [Penicillium nordicum]|uniref:Uncharacterized protein n=1 Tax=Penicillium nordicum TaxID=229535 RepID=A0A0M8NV77_9EURO|nr:hypothetical protein ACN38_g11208 [Penicillium nordicum]